MRHTKVTKPVEVQVGISKLQGLHTKYSVAERRSRLNMLEADASARRWQKLILTIMVALLVLCALAVYVVVMLSGTYDAEDKERAEKILTPIIACLLGYIGGSSRGKH